MELPFRVFVSVIVAAITIPAMVNGLAAYEADAVSIRVVGVIDTVVQLAQQFYLSGGGSEDVRIELRGGMTVRLEYVEFGDVPGGPRATTARYKLGGAAEVALLADPLVPMAGDRGPLRVGVGPHAVRVTYDGEGPVRLAVVG
ncbi:MAG: hypothetical protein HY557_00905 [Euryarchaeota archaeon]|nr:hypothetical protein [Euryarchaeota archaeon]